MDQTDVPVTGHFASRPYRSPTVKSPQPTRDERIRCMHGWILYPGPQLYRDPALRDCFPFSFPFNNLQLQLRGGSRRPCSSHEHIVPRLLIVFERQIVPGPKDEFNRSLTTQTTVNINIPTTAMGYFAFANAAAYFNRAM